jgi:hypothetical protein
LDGCSTLHAPCTPFTPAFLPSLCSLPGEVRLGLLQGLPVEGVRCGGDRERLREWMFVCVCVCMRARAL